MNQKKRTQEKNKFSKLRLHSSSQKSGKSCSPRPQEKISSYFSSTLNESNHNLNFENTSDDLSDNIITRLRNKKCVKKISTKTSSELNTNSETPDDINDFTKSGITKVAKKLEGKSNNFDNLTKYVNKRKIQFVSNPKVDSSKNDTDQEHLQLAIAMSKSILELENPQDSERMENIYPSTQQKIIQVKQTLDQFGFKSEKSSTQLNSKTNVKLMKRKKCKYITPTLYLRTEAERTKLIENNVSQIINNISIYNKTIQLKHEVATNNVDNKPRSFILRDYYKEKPILFNKNALCISDARENIFYNSIIEPSNVKVGVLLKDWLIIPGREATPPLEENISPNKLDDNLVNILQVPSIEISMSPELFTVSDDETTEHIEINNTSRRGFFNSRDSITKIDKEKNIESYSSTKSVSLLDNIKVNNNKKVSIINMSASRTELVDLSLSPFPDTSKLLSIDTTKQIKLTHDLGDKNNENSDSLSPFESVSIQINKSPQRKVTPKKESPSPKKYVVTPKGRKMVSLNYRKNNSPCKRSISFIEKPDVETIHNDSNKNSEICHFESFCNDYIECFDLTHSSDDEFLELEKNNKSDNITNKSFTITQLLNEISSGKSILNEENTNKDQMSNDDSQASIETMKLNISKSNSNLNEEYSPEFDCLNISNNKVFYEILNNSLLSNNDDDMISSKKFSNNLTKNEEQNVIDLANSDESCDSEIHDNKTISSTPINVKNIEENAIKIPLINDETNYSFLSLNTNVNKRNSAIFRRSYSENFIKDKKKQKESTPLNKYFELSTTDKKLSRSVNEVEWKDLNFSIDENNDNIFLSRSSISTCSDISDEELNYSCKSIYKRKKNSNKAISISDEENDRLISAPENENISVFNLHLHEALMITPNSAIENNLCSINKSLQHPRVSKLNTPIKLMKTNLSNHSYHNKQKSLLGEKMIQETITSINIGTPKTDIIINANNITPKGHYSDMDTPEINIELEKFGLKPMKRNKGVKILHYIYDSTHPYVNESSDGKILNNSSDDENGTATKRRKTKSNEVYNEEIFSKDVQNDNLIFYDYSRKNKNQITESENIEDMIFERKQSTKISSCRLPLHVAWNNLLMNSKELQETILTYTPVQVEEIYEQLKKLGFKYHIQDIVSFLDKKCITIRIAQNNKHQKKENSIK